jgi:hypothetical protein
MSAWDFSIEKLDFVRVIGHDLLRLLSVADVQTLPLCNEIRRGHFTHVHEPKTLK